MWTGQLITNVMDVEHHHELMRPTQSRVPFHVHFKEAFGSVIEYVIWKISRDRTASWFVSRV